MEVEEICGNCFSFSKPKVFFMKLYIIIRMPLANEKNFIIMISFSIVTGDSRSWESPKELDIV